MSDQNQCPECRHDLTDSDHEVSHMQYVRGREQLAALAYKPAPQIVNIHPVVLAPAVQSGQDIALRDGEEVFIPPVPGPPLDVSAMEQQLIEAGIDEETRQAVMEKVVEAQIQFLAHQLSDINWFLAYEPAPPPVPGEARPANTRKLDPLASSPLRLKTVAYDHGRMEVTFLMGAPNDAPEGQTPESEADKATEDEPPEDEDRSPVEQPRDVAART